MSTRQAQREDTVERVLSAAERAFSTNGFAGTTVRDIATESGLSVGTVMSVGEKDALLIATMDNRIAALHDARASIADLDAGGTASNASNAGAPGTDPFDCVSRATGLFAPFAELFTTRPELARAYASILVSGRHTSVVFTDLAATLVGEIAEALILCEHRPRRAGGERALAEARGIYLAYLGLLFTWPAADETRTTELLAALQRVLEPLMHPEGTPHPGNAERADSAEHTTRGTA